MKIRSPEHIWSTKFNAAVSWMQNAMTKRAFMLHRRFIHFVDSGTLHARGTSGHDKLGKIRPILTHYQRAFKANWTIGKRVAVDEAMIRYTGHAIGWVQYMPAKPIKKGIKVWCACCSDSGYLHSFEIYTGAEEGVDGSVVGIVDRLFEGSNFESTHHGRVLYTDNYYTSLTLMKYIWIKYKMFLVGTVRLSKKKSRVVTDFPFHKLQNGALSRLKRGWFRRATWDMPTPQESGPASMRAEASVTKDRKQVAVLNNFEVGPPTDDDTMLRRVTGFLERQNITAPAALIAYNMWMDAVDRKDRDTADWGISLRSYRWYLAIFYWLVNSQVACMFCVHKATDDEKKYDKKHGRYNWQLDLAQALIADALGKEWGVTEEQRGSTEKPWGGPVPHPLPFEPWCPIPSKEAAGKDDRNLTGSNGQAW